MMRALWTAGSGMLAQQMNVDTISNNLANVNTIGYKKMRAEFEDLLYQTIREAGSSTAQGRELPTGLQVGHGCRTVATTKTFTQGDYQQTGNELDMLIGGDGFFQIQMPDGTIEYTRSGAFKVDSEGKIVNSEGFYLEPEITIPEETTEISISQDGIVSVLLAGETTTQEIGQIELVRFINPAGLINDGNSLYRQSAASGTPQVTTPGSDGSGTIVQQYLEMSNVQIVDEMISMIVAQRAYEINSKAVQASDEMLQTANSLRS